jgi:hypothetical protein
MSFSVAEPQPKHSWKSIFLAFKPSLWGLIMFTVLFTGGQVLVFENFLYYKFSKKDSSVKKPLSPGQTVMVMFGSLIGQPSSQPGSTSTNLIYIVWLMFGLIVNTAYNTKLTSFITSPKADPTPKTFEALVNSDYGWGSSPSFHTGVAGDSFCTSKNPIVKQLYSEMQKEKNDIRCTKRTSDEKYACWAWEFFLQFYFHTVFTDRSGHHPFKLAEERTLFIYGSFATKKVKFGDLT